MDELIKADRRTFMRRGAVGAGALWLGSLHEFGARSSRRGPVVVGGVSPYGPVSPTRDQTTGLELLKLPEGFRYWSYSWTGDIMADGVVCPNLHDGMAVVDDWRPGRDRRGDGDRPGSSLAEREPDDSDDNDDDGEETRERDDRSGRAGRGGRSSGRVVLVRNHEGGAGVPYVAGRPDITYAPTGSRTGSGGTTNLVFDTRRGEWVTAFSSLAGTLRNCAGGVTPWGSWITCEETGEPGHGWNFDVSPEGGDTTPLTDMGRFSHEALMIDPKSGVAYQTEDSGNCGLYRFAPHRRGRYERGGTLHMLAVRRQPNLDLGVSHSIGSRWDVRWVRIDDPTAAATSCFQQGWALGGARFSRLEGAWWGEKTGFFLSTDGGSVGEGQVFEYDPRDESLTLIYDATNATDLDNPDNLTVTPRGGLLLCEDAAGNNFTEGERLVGLTLNGETFTFAMNNVNLASDYSAAVRRGDYRQSEWAGACYSPDGKWLFANIQTPGITFAITGPWGKGPL